MKGLEGKAAVVTGGSRGIGYACVERLLGEGVKVLFTGRSQANGTKAIENLPVEMNLMKNWMEYIGEHASDADNRRDTKIDTTEWPKHFIDYIHLVDSNRQAPGFGHIDFKSIIKTLNEIKYNGVLSCEILPLPSSLTAAKQAIKYIKSII